MNHHSVNPLDSFDNKENQAPSNHQITNPSSLSPLNSIHGSPKGISSQEKSKSPSTTYFSLSESPLKFTDEDLSNIISQFTTEDTSIPHPKDYSLLNRKRIRQSMHKTTKSNFITYKHNKKYSNGSISLLSYNILNQLYMKKPNRDDLSIPNRLKKIKQEILELSPDIFCIQEADLMIYQTYFKLFNSYNTLYGVNCGSSFVNVIGYNKEKYSLKTFKNFSLLYLGKSSGNRGIMNITLEDNATREIVSVYNVHFPFKFESDRMKMVKMIFEHMEESKIHNVIIAGDFNSEPRSLVMNMFSGREREEGIEDEQWNMMNYELMKRIDKGFKMRSGYQYYMKGKGEECDERKDYHPKYTTRTQYFKKTIDYILFSKGMKPKKILRIPGENEVEIEKFLPSTKYPSDHLKIYCEFIIKSKKTGHYAR